MIKVVVTLCSSGVRCGGDEVMMIGDNGGHNVFQCVDKFNKAWLLWW